MVAQGDGKFGPERLTPESLQTKKQTKNWIRCFPETGFFNKRHIVFLFLKIFSPTFSEPLSSTALCSILFLFLPWRRRALKESGVVRTGGRERVAGRGVRRVELQPGLVLAVCGGAGAAVAAATPGDAGRTAGRAATHRHGAGRVVVLRLGLAALEGALVNVLHQERLDACGRQAKKFCIWHVFFQLF